MWIYQTTEGTKIDLDRLTFGERIILWGLLNDIERQIEIAIFRSEGLALT